MPKQIIFMFSGQGSQYYHMGAELFEKHPVFREWMLRLDDIVRKNIGESVAEQIYSRAKKKSDMFNRTLHTHPAIFMVEYALVQTLISEGIKPDFVLGTSMGEFASAVCANVMDLEEIVETLIEQARALETCPAGGMLAILANAEMFKTEPFLYDNSELAAVNFDQHFVVSGLDESLCRIMQQLKEKRINYQLLPVSQAFHSSFIDSAAYKYTSYLAQKSYKQPTIKLISGAHGEEMKNISDTYLWDVVRKPMIIQKVIQQLEEKGNYNYIDLGPAGTLANFVKYNLQEGATSKHVQIITPFGKELKNISDLHNLLK